MLVKLSDLSRALDSDRYYTEEYRELTENVLRKPVLQPRQPLPRGGARGWSQGVEPGGRARVAIHSSRTGLSKPKW